MGQLHKEDDANRAKKKILQVSLKMQTAALKDVKNADNGVSTTQSSKS